MVSDCILKERKCPNSFGRLHVNTKKAVNSVLDYGGFYFYSLSFFFRKVSNVITVSVMVAMQVTKAITNSKVITSLPSQLFLAVLDLSWDTPPEF